MTKIYRLAALPLAAAALLAVATPAHATTYGLTTQTHTSQWNRTISVSVQLESLNINGVPGLRGDASGRCTNGAGAPYACTSMTSADVRVYLDGLLWIDAGFGCAPGPVATPCTSPQQNATTPLYRLPAGSHLYRAEVLVTVKSYDDTHSFKVSSGSFWLHP